MPQSSLYMYVYGYSNKHDHEAWAKIWLVGKCVENCVFIHIWVATSPYVTHKYIGCSHLTAFVSLVHCSSRCEFCLGCFVNPISQLFHETGLISPNGVVELQYWFTREIKLEPRKKFVDLVKMINIVETTIELSSLWCISCISLSLPLSTWADCCRLAGR